MKLGVQHRVPPRIPGEPGDKASTGAQGEQRPCVQHRVNPLLTWRKMNLYTLKACSMLLLATYCNYVGIKQISALFL